MRGAERLEAVQELAADGLSNRAIADVLGVGHQTVNRDLNGSNEPPDDDDLPPDPDDDTIERRDLTKGQKAMALAVHYPEPEKARPGKVSETVLKIKAVGMNAGLLSQARQILAYSQRRHKAVADVTLRTDSSASW